jgi:hypothetical protein
MVSNLSFQKNGTLVEAIFSPAILWAAIWLSWIHKKAFSTRLAAESQDWGTGKEAKFDALQREAFGTHAF